MVGEALIVRDNSPHLRCVFRRSPPLQTGLASDLARTVTRVVCTFVGPQQVHRAVVPSLGGVPTLDCGGFPQFPQCESPLLLYHTLFVGVLIWLAVEGKYMSAVKVRHLNGHSGGFFAINILVSLGL